MTGAAAFARRYGLPVALFVVGVLLAAASLIWRDHARRPHYRVAPR